MGLLAPLDPLGKAGNSALLISTRLATASIDRDFYFVWENITLFKAYFFFYSIGSKIFKSPAISFLLFGLFLQSSSVTCLHLFSTM